MANNGAAGKGDGVQRRILITGGVSGLGRALVDEYLAESETQAIHVWDVDEEAGRKLATAHGAIDFQRVDLGNEEEVAAASVALVKSAEEVEETVDTVICNAGISCSGGFPHTDWETEMQVMRINLHGHLRLLRELLAARAISRRGRVAFVVSASVVLPFPVAVVYAASKAGLNGFADALEPWLRHYGISVTRIYPGPMRTPHQMKYYAEMRPHSGATPEKIGRISASAIRRRKRRVFPDGPSKFFRFLSAAANWSMPMLMHRYSKKFPEMLYPEEQEKDAPLS
jgi:short-subunit dehydrogenase